MLSVSEVYVTSRRTARYKLHHRGTVHSIDHAGKVVKELRTKKMSLQLKGHFTIFRVVTLENITQSDLCLPT